jgi:hypothetical protein
MFAIMSERSTKRETILVQTSLCSGDPHRFRIHTHAESMTFRFNRNRITPFLKNLDTSSSRSIPSDVDALRLLVAYAGKQRQETQSARPMLRAP